MAALVAKLVILSIPIAAYFIGAALLTLDGAKMLLALVLLVGWGVALRFETRSALEFVVNAFFHAMFIEFIASPLVLFMYGFNSWFLFTMANFGMVFWSFLLWLFRGVGERRDGPEPGMGYAFAGVLGGSAAAAAALHYGMSWAAVFGLYYAAVELVFLLLELRRYAEELERRERVENRYAG